MAFDVGASDYSKNQLPLQFSCMFLRTSEFSGSDIELIPCDMEEKEGKIHLSPGRSENPIIPNLNLSYFPGSACDEKEYLQKLQDFGGFIQDLPKQYVQNLLEDPYLNIPSNTKLFDEFIPTQVLIDFPRISRFVINKDIIYDSSKKESEITPQALLLKALPFLDDICLMMEISKLATHASFGRPFTILSKGFSFEKLDLHLTAASRFQVQIVTTNQPKIKIYLTAIFDLKKADDEEFKKFILVRREIFCESEYLKSRKGNARIRDIYSPVYTSFEDEVKKCDFNQLEKSIKLHLSEGALLAKEKDDWVVV